MAGHALTPATRLRLGEPLPHQQPDRTFPAPKAAEAFDPKTTSSITPSFPGLSSTWGYVGTYSSPLRRSTHPRRGFRARLACFSHAASVQSEPGSNSSICCVISTAHRNELQRLHLFGLAIGFALTRNQSVTLVPKTNASGRRTRY